ncbi:TY-Chap domain-containing protein [Nocardia sp. NBC_01327]|uniref:TY-Chap domain-containing protein n=1 Tax=Nocardia sp. NBC_01327 TaxID=2903593 RepID=UPI002E151E02|nr:hypothetical protein OG326_30830 [Nocardia sp. NBC_01327]
MSFDIDRSAAERAVIQLLAPDVELPNDTDSLTDLLWVKDIVTYVLLDDCHGAILDHIRALPSYPSDMDWSWYRDYISELPFLDHGEGIDRLLELIAEHCRQLGVLMVSLDTRADNHAVGFVEAKHWQRNADVVTQAHPLLSIIREGSLSRLGGDTQHGPHQLAELRRQAEQRRQDMTEWERFAENIVALLDGGPVGTMAVLDCSRGGVQFSDEPDALSVESLRDDATRDDTEINQVLAEQGWAPFEESWGPVWEYRMPARYPRYIGTYRQFADQVVIGLRASKINSPTELTVYGYNIVSQADEPDLSVLGIPVTDG